MTLWARVILCLTFFSTISQVHAMFPGFNVGVQGGMVRLTGKHRFLNGAGQFGDFNAMGNGFGGGGYAGYVFEAGGGSTHLVIGVDAFMNMYSVSSTNTLTINSGAIQGNVNIAHKSSMGAGLIVGVLVNPRVVGYGGLSFENDKYKLSYTGLTFQPGFPQETYNKNSTAFLIRLGASLSLSKNFYAGLEFGFPITKKILVRNNLQAVNGVQYGYTYKPAEMRLLLRLGFRFG